MTWYQRGICLVAALIFVAVMWPTGEIYAWVHLVRGLAVVGGTLFVLAAVRPTKPPS